MKVGDIARLKAPEVRGNVVEVDKDDETRVLLEWAGQDGETHQRWFHVDQLEAADAPAKAKRSAKKG